MVIMFFLGEEQDDVFVNGRMFVSAIGINQDPVTGNANVSYTIDFLIPAKHHLALQRNKERKWGGKAR
jgi:predicted PhzF superfamily epimerase YddE/YHI9